LGSCNAFLVKYRACKLEETPSFSVHSYCYFLVQADTPYVKTSAPFLQIYGVPAFSACKSETSSPVNGFSYY